jgi:hypothetical protein
MRVWVSTSPDLSSGYEATVLDTRPWRGGGGGYWRERPTQVETGETVSLPGAFLVGHGTGVLARTAAGYFRVVPLGAVKAEITDEWKAEQEQAAATRKQQAQEREREVREAWERASQIRERARQRGIPVGIGRDVLGAPSYVLSGATLLRLLDLVAATEESQ